MRILAVFLAQLALAGVIGICSRGETAEPKPVRALVVTGGHDFEREPFLDVFRSMEGVTFREVAHPNAHALLKPSAAGDYDVVVLYDMWQPITDEAKQDLVNLFKRGKGLVALHHCLAGYNDWPEYAKLIGGRFRLKKETVNGVERPISGYQHDVKFTVHIADPKHPVTRGMKDFEILDETYADFDVDSGVTPLITTEHPTSGKLIGWAHTYGKSRVAYIQLGHDHKAYENPGFRQLVRQAIGWAAKGK